MTLRIALAQLNPTVGDVQGNRDRVADALEEARGRGADVVAFPEGVLPGYPPEDLLLKTSFVDAVEDAVADLAPRTEGLTAVVGAVRRDDDLVNAAAVLHDGAVAGWAPKLQLPNYGVFDEERWFRPGDRTVVLEREGVRVGVSVCEDIWYPGGPSSRQALAGDADVLLNLSASPYRRGKIAERTRMLQTRASDNLSYVVFVNQVGGQDELVFDGSSLVAAPDGEIVTRATSFQEDLLVADLDPSAVHRSRLHEPRRRKAPPRGGPPIEVLPLAGTSGPPPTGDGAATAGLPDPPEGPAELYQALCLGLRDYVTKNGFREVVLGSSGGIDSSLTAAVAADALDPDRVHGIALPARYSSRESLADAKELASNLGIHHRVVDVDPLFETALETLGDQVDLGEGTLARENLQPRLRGVALMAFSNAEGWLVLSAGNKSETSLGYATLYGDTTGGFAPIGDVLKTTVYELARWRNEQPDGPVIPQRVLDKPPSAELRPDQTDQDDLPPYREVDPVLAAYVEEGCDVDEIVARGHDEDVVREVVARLDASEYKRRQSPPVLKVSSRAFGRDWRFPITNGWDRGR